jgi:hypothetical protein
VLLAQPYDERFDARATALVADLASPLLQQAVDVALDGEQEIDAPDVSSALGALLSRAWSKN